MPRIPVNPSDLPTQGDRFKPMNEALTYQGTIELIGTVTKDKNDHDYFSIRIRVTSPEEYVNRVLYDNYVSLPWPVEDWMDAKQREMAAQSGDRLGDIARSAGITGGSDGWDTDELKDQEITFTISNEEYQGQVRSRPRSYLLPKEEDKVPF